MRSWGNPTGRMRWSRRSKPDSTRSKRTIRSSSGRPVPWPLRTKASGSTGRRIPWSSARLARLRDAPRVGGLATDEFGFDLSLERLELLDLDALIWLDAEDEGEAFTTNAVYNNLAVHTEGRDVLLDSERPDALGGATSFVTVLSIPFLLDGLVPLLAAAIDGDAATT